ncbi:MAG: extracellular solute-binding protein [Clostridia bacterium]|nr:extracellular solute-binding protein [Clostridia bacterium]
MKNKLLEKVICLLLTVTLLATGLGFTASAASLKEDPNEKNPYNASTLVEMQSLVGTVSYEDYIASYLKDGIGFDSQLSVKQVENILNCEGGTPVSESSYCTSSMIENAAAWSNFGDNVANTVYLSATGSASWDITFTEEEAGFYYIQIEYYDCSTAESSISSIERKLKIDGKVPFDEVSSINLNKNWVYNNVEVITEPAPGAENSYAVNYYNNADGYFKIVESVVDGVKTTTRYTLSKDINGNSMASTAVTASKWNTYIVQDSTGYYTDYFAFYMASGTRTITIEAEREPMIIKSITLIPASDSGSSIPTYEEYLEKYKEKDGGILKPANGGSVIELRAEFPDKISDSSVTPTNDNTSAITTPVDASCQLYNVIGENSYSSVGQWAAYNFRVTETGFYNIAMRYKQSALEGMYVCRAIKLAGGSEEYGYGLSDGTPVAPFSEAYDAEFQYNKKWQSTYVTSGDTEFMFYFEEGYEYTLYLECSLGTLKDLIQRAESVLEDVNACYLRILQLTGSEPDKNRDYDFINVMPDVLVTLLESGKELMNIKDELEALCGTSGSHTATLETVAILLHTMGEDYGEDIARNMTTFKSYLGTLGTWINDSKSSTIIVDNIWITPTSAGAGGNAKVSGDNLPRANAPWYKTIWFEICAFFNSFFVEYDQMGLTTIPDENTVTIDVWLAYGRDQSQIWRTMIDAYGSYTDSTGNAVALKLVTAGTLLPSILSGKGPDVYIGLGASDVINYAIRDAVVGMSGNAKTTDKWTDEDNAVFSTTYYTYKTADGYVTTTEERVGETPSFVSRPYDEFVAPDEVFSQAALDTITLLDVSYGVPQTMSFAMMFYRMDVLAELGVEVPESWDEMISILNVLQANNMNIGVSYLSALDFMIYQKGGSMWMYTEDWYDSKYAGAKIALDSNVALEAFRFTTKLYTDYSFPVSYDAANRFRTGEMPIIIGDYASVYNQLVVYATEIEGLWEFCSLPGSQRADGSFNYDSLAGVSATVILNGVGENLLPAWQFVQWQTSEEAQAEYGNRMVALIGPSAKYETANLKAINNLSWTAKEKKAIMNQMDHMSSIVNYPGSYIINRYMQFAFFDVVNENANPVDAMRGYIDAINTEITRKREEFKHSGLWTPSEDEKEPPMLYNPENPASTSNN